MTRRYKCFNVEERIGSPELTFTLRAIDGGIRQFPSLSTSRAERPAFLQLGTIIEIELREVK